MPLLLLICLILACLPIDWPGPPFGLGLGGSAALTITTVIGLLLVARLVSSATVSRLAHDPGDRVVIARTHNLRRLLFSFLNLGGFGFILLGCGWGYTTNQLLTIDDRFLPGGELLVLAPYLITLLGSWAIFFDAERALNHASPDPSASREYWTRWSYVSFLFRLHVITVFIPVGFTIFQFSVLRISPGLFESPLAKVATVGGVIAFLVFLPSLVPVLLRLEAMPPGRLRDRLESSARRLGVRYHNLYIWNTRGSLATAMVAGLIPRFRQIVFTDLLLALLTEDEVEAVLGHEIGHVRHWHLLHYTAFLVLSLLTLAGIYHVAGQVAGLSQQSKDAALVLTTVATGAYLFLVFGFVSRRCERQADVFGCKAVSCADPACRGHGPDTTLVAGGRGLCRTGVGTFVRALERVDEINGTSNESTSARRGLFGRMAGMLRFVGIWLSAWQHSTIANRVAFLRSLADEPQRERRFQRRVTVLRWGLLAILAAGVIVIVAWNGWRSLLDAV